jgi:hypothetical protein
LIQVLIYSPCCRNDGKVPIQRGCEPEANLELDIAASGISIASLALQVGDCIVKLKTFCGAVKNAPEEVGHLIEEQNRNFGSVKAVLKRDVVEKLRGRLTNAQSMLMLSNQGYLV